VRVTDVDERLRDASRNCTSMVVWHPRTEPAEVFAALAKACEELGVEEWDTYGEGGAVDLVERQVAELLGKPAAAFFVSGTMAQQAMLRVCASGAGRCGWRSRTSRTC
jgi:threonine aldolase